MILHQLAQEGDKLYYPGADNTRLENKYKKFSFADHSPQGKMADFSSKIGINDNSTISTTSESAISKQRYNKELKMDQAKWDKEHPIRSSVGDALHSIALAPQMVMDPRLLYDNNYFVEQRDNNSVKKIITNGADVASWTIGGEMAVPLAVMGRTLARKTAGELIYRGVSPFGYELKNVKQIPKNIINSFKGKPKVGVGVGEVAPETLRVRDDLLAVSVGKQPKNGTIIFDEAAGTWSFNEKSVNVQRVLNGATNRAHGTPEWPVKDLNSLFTNEGKKRVTLDTEFQAMRNYTQYITPEGYVKYKETWDVHPFRGILNPNTKLGKILYNLNPIETLTGIKPPKLSGTMYKLRTQSRPVLHGVDPANALTNARSEANRLIESGEISANEYKTALKNAYTRSRKPIVVGPQDPVVDTYDLMRRYPGMADYVNGRGKIGVNVYEKLNNIVNHPYKQALYDMYKPL